MSFTEYMSFDLGWFTTLPGICITGGLILFLAGFIFFILSGKKDKNEEVKTEEKPVENANATTEGAPAAAPVAEVTPEVAPEKVEEVKVEEKTVENANTATETVVTPEVTPAAPVVEATPVVEEAVAPAVEVMPEAVPTVEEPAVPAVESLEEEPAVVLEVPAAPVAEATPVVEEVVAPEKTEEPAPAIYGGANPTVTIEADSEPKQVYGGADPLENTGALPRVEVPAAPVVEATPVVEEVTPAVTETLEEVKPAEVEVPVETLVVEEEKKEEKPATDDVETLEF